MSAPDLSGVNTTKKRAFEGSERVDKKRWQTDVELAEAQAANVEDKQTEFDVSLAAAEQESLLARERTETGVRKFVTLTIVMVFAFMVLSVLAFFVASGWWPPTDPGVVDRVLDLLQGPILSVLTLVLGYYFGTAAKR